MRRAKSKGTVRPVRSEEEAKEMYDRELKQAERRYQTKIQAIKTDMAKAAACAEYVAGATIEQLRTRYRRLIPIADSNFYEMLRRRGIKSHAAKKAEAEVAAARAAVVQGPIPPETAGLGLDYLAASTRSLHYLREFRIETIGQLAQCSEAEILRIPNLGRHSLEDIKHALREHGLSLGMEAA